MSDYRAPIDDTRFVLNEVVGWDRIAGLPGYEDATPDLVDAVLGFVGVAISLYPFIVPWKLDIHTASAPPASQGFVLIAAAICVPMILGYTWYAYWAFRGKVRVGGGHDN